MTYERFNTDNAAEVSVSEVNRAESARILTPQNSTLILIDYQPQTVVGVQSHVHSLVMNNVVGLAKTAKVFDLPTILTTVAAETFTGPLMQAITDVYPDKPVYDRSSLNAWTDNRVVGDIEKAGRKKLIMAGLWTELCLTLPVLSALDHGYEVYIVTDASGGASAEAHAMGIERMVQAGAVPMTWIGVISELQYDWADTETYEAVNQLVIQHAGAWGAGVEYYRAKTEGLPENRSMEDVKSGGS